MNIAAIWVATCTAASSFTSVKSFRANTLGKKHMQMFMLANVREPTIQIDGNNLLNKKKQNHLNNEFQTIPVDCPIQMDAIYVIIGYKIPTHYGHCVQSCVWLRFWL